MAKLIIRGGKKLSGAVDVAGMKNAATPILAATLLATKRCVIKNIPDIADVRVMLKILESLGQKIDYKNHTATISPGKIHLGGLEAGLVQKLRSSILIMGPLLARLGRADLPEPGGCIIGKRPIDTHLIAFQKMGATIKCSGKHLSLACKKLHGREVILPEFSVTATENVMMAAALAEGTTTIKLAALEPHVEDLADFLKKLGAKIHFKTPHTIVIEGVKNLGGAEHTLIPDSIEVGTFAVAAVITGGKITMRGVRHDHLDAVYSLLERIGAKLEIKGSNLTVSAGKNMSAFKLQAMPYPGFPTDLQAPFGLLATQCAGMSMIQDPLYEGRFSYVGELTKMGADATVCDPHRVIFAGPTKLQGTTIKGLDLRAGATLVLAGLAASGTTTVEGVENLDRGYERFDERLRALGADIKRAE
jgi:UDP-N-acetylglucosamine 1-carboxyvinyltransferase